MNRKQQNYSFEDTWMDHPAVLDRFLHDPAYRVSARAQEVVQPDRPVIICAHGYTASTYEWEEFREYAEANSEVLVSNVLLGAHGRSIYEFENSTWQQWQEPILTEYRALVDMGYENISLMGSSTGGTLILQNLLEGGFSYRNRNPRQVILIDPFIIAADKIFYLTPLASLFIRNLPYRKFSEEERKHWYVNRPISTLVQLYGLLKKLVRMVKRRPVLPAGTHLTIYKARVDSAANPAGALLVGKCLRQADGTSPEIKLVETTKHVFTRGQGRVRWGKKDRQQQQQTFAEIIGKLREPARAVVTP